MSKFGGSIWGTKPTTKKIKKNKIIEILQHKISYYYRQDQVMPEYEQEHIKEMIIKGYNQGELNCLMPDDSENRGWWSIIK